MVAAESTRRRLVVRTDSGSSRTTAHLRKRISAWLESVRIRGRFQLGGDGIALHAARQKSDRGSRKMRARNEIFKIEPVGHYARLLYAGSHRLPPVCRGRLYAR